MKIVQEQVQEEYPPQLIIGAPQLPNVQENQMISSPGQDISEEKLPEPRELRNPSTAAIAPEEVKNGGLLSQFC